MKIVFNKSEVRDIIKHHARTLVEPHQLNGMRVVVSESQDGRYEARFLEEVETMKELTEGGESDEDNRS
jgi:hypothetical protein